MPYTLIWHSKLVNICNSKMLFNKTFFFFISHETHDNLFIVKKIIWLEEFLEVLRTFQHFVFTESVYNGIKVLFRKFKGGHATLIRFTMLCRTLKPSYLYGINLKTKTVKILTKNLIANDSGVLTSDIRVSMLLLFN